jgi:hypothetical protein
MESAPKSSFKRSKVKVNRTVTNLDIRFQKYIIVMPPDATVENVFGTLDASVGPVICLSGFCARFQSLNVCISMITERDTSTCMLPTYEVDRYHWQQTRRVPIWCKTSQSYASFILSEQTSIEWIRLRDSW